MIRNEAGQVVRAGLKSIATGLDFAGGPVVVYVTGDNNAQAIGTVGAGVATLDGHGVYNYFPSADETNFASVTFTFTCSGALTADVTYGTVTAAQQAAFSAATGTATSRTWKDIIRAALRRVNVLQINMLPNADIEAICFELLQDWVDEISNERLTIPVVQRSTFTITSTKGTLASPYTVGVGGDVDINRPSLQADVIIKYLDNLMSPPREYPLAQLTDQAWRGLSLKDLTATLPSASYYSPTYDGNFASLYLFPVPTRANLLGVIYYPSQLARPVAVTDTVTLPPGYYAYIRDSIAIMFGTTLRENVPIDPRLIASQQKAEGNIKRANARTVDMITVSGFEGPRGLRYNIFTDN